MPTDILALLRRGGELTKNEERQLLEEWQEAKLTQLSGAISARTTDQPVKVVPLQADPPKLVGGYFTQQKFIIEKAPEDMGMILGTFGKFNAGALILQFSKVLSKGDYESRAYTYLPDGKPWKFNPDEKVYLPGKGAPQWQLTLPVEAECIAKVMPHQRYQIGPRYAKTL